MKRIRNAFFLFGFVFLLGAGSALAQNFCNFPGCLLIERVGYTSYAGSDQQIFCVAENMDVYKNTFAKVSKDLFQPDVEKHLKITAEKEGVASVDSLFQDYVVLFMILMESDSGDFNFAVKNPEPNQSISANTVLECTFTPGTGVRPREHNNRALAKPTLSMPKKGSKDQTKRDYAVVAIPRSELQDSTGKPAKSISFVEAKWPDSKAPVQIPSCSTLP